MSLFYERRRSDVTLVLATAFSVLFIRNTGINAQCPDPGLPENGYFVSPSNPVFPMDTNSTLEFGCSNGYTMFGNPVLQCVEEGLWKNQLVICTELSNVVKTGQITSMSSQRFTWSHSKKAIDGDYDSYYQTNDEENPWWKLDLGGLNDVTHVVVWLKNSSWFSTHMYGTVIRVGLDNDISQNTQCGPVFDEALLELGPNPVILTCNGTVRSRYISMQRENITGQLNAGEVEVIGRGLCEYDPGIPDNGYRISSDPSLPLHVGTTTLQYACNNGTTMHGESTVGCVSGSTWNSLPLCTDLQNVVLNKDTQISTEGNMPASNGVDGNLLTYFATGSGYKNPWWKVDLGALYEVHYIYVKNRRQDGCDACYKRWLGMTIRAGVDSDYLKNQQCGDKINASTTELQEVLMSCQPVVHARYVSAQIEGRSVVLNLGEVKVFGVVLCEDPGVPDFGSRSSTGVTFPVYEDTSIDFQCDPGMELIGNKTIGCTSSGDWHASLPVCKSNSTTSTVSSSPTGGALSKTTNVDSRTLQTEIPSSGPTLYKEKQGMQTEERDGSSSWQLYFLIFLAIVPLILVLVIVLTKKKWSSRKLLYERKNSIFAIGKDGRRRESKLAWP